MNLQTNFGSAVQSFYESANENGLIHTLYTAFKPPFQIEIPIYSKISSASVDELELSVRAQNCLKRAGIMSVARLINIAATDELLKLRNLGRKSYTEIKSKLLVFAYSSLSEHEKKEFWRSFLKNNSLS